MPKSIGPLLSLKASGSIAGNLTFSERKTGSQVRWQKKQKDVLTSDRVEHRARFLEAVASWNALSEEEKLDYKQRAVSLALTGYNLYLKEYLLAPPVIFYPAYLGVLILGVSELGYVQ